MKMFYQLKNKIIDKIDSFFGAILPPPKTHYFIPLYQDHEERGDETCPNCNKKFITSTLWCTMDVVYIFDKPERLSTTMYYCPHCCYSYEAGYTPMPNFEGESV